MSRPIVKVESTGDTRLVSSLSSLPRTLGSSCCLLQQSRDNVVCNVKELLVDLLVLTEIVIPSRAGERRITDNYSGKKGRIYSVTSDWKSQMYFHLLLVSSALQKHQVQIKKCAPGGNAHLQHCNSPDTHTPTLKLKNNWEAGKGSWWMGRECGLKGQVFLAAAWELCV